MSQRDAKTNSSPVTRSLHGARVTSKALSRSAKSRTSSRTDASIIIPSPAKPARGSKSSAHIVSFADAKKAGGNAKTRTLASPASMPSHSRHALNNVPDLVNRGNHVAAGLGQDGASRRGMHASQDLPKKEKRGIPQKATKSIMKKIKLPGMPFGRKRGKEFVIPSGEDLTTESSNIFANMASRESRGIPKKGKSVAVSKAVQSSAVSLSANQPSSAISQPRKSKDLASQAIVSRKLDTRVQNETNSGEISDPLKEAESESVDGKKTGKSRLALMMSNRKERAKEKKRAKTKAKAEKKFEKTYGKTGKAVAATEAGPRAALYSAEMGKTQKKTLKMKIKDAREMAYQSVGLVGGMVSNFEIPTPPKHLTRALIAVVIVAIFGFGLYGPAQQYYIQMRETDRLQAEYTEVAARTNNLASSIDALHTQEGIEDKAHKDLGYVKSGEKSATVKGIASINLLELPTSNVAPGSIPAPDTWYSGALDILFGYRGYSS